MEVEVKVTDKHGQPVPDLKPVDFTLLEDGEPQTIRTFEYVTEPGSDRSVKPDSRSTKAEPIRLDTPLPRDGFPAGTTWVYVTGQVNHEDRKRTWREMNKFLDESLRPGVLVSIEDSGFTSNRADLQTALQELMEKRSKPGSAELPSDLDTVDFGSLEYEPEFQSQVDSLNESFANLNGLQANYRGDFFLYRYIDLVRSLSVLPGKKVVVLLTRSALRGPGNRDALRRLIGEAIRSRVTFHIVETPRLSAKLRYVPDSTFPGYALSPGGSQRDTISSAEYNLPSINMNMPPSKLANPTGGKSANTIMGLGRVLTAASESLRGYYLLGYTPTEATEGDYRRKVRVAVNRPSLRLDYRKTYYEKARFDRLSSIEKGIELNHYLKYDLPATDIPLTLSYDFFRGDDGKVVLYASVGIHSSYVPLAVKKRRSEIRFVVASQATPTDAEQSPVHAGKNVRIRARAKFLDGFQQDPAAVLHVPFEMQIKPGPYEWKIVLRDDTGSVGSYKTEIVVPEFTGEGQSSSLFLTGCYSHASAPRDDPSTTIRRPGVSHQSEIEGVIGDRKRFYTDASHTYGQGDLLYLVYDLYDLEAEDESALPATKLMLLQGEQQMGAPEVTAYRFEWSRKQSNVRYTLALSSKNLEPGDYRLLAVLPGDKYAIFRDFRIVPNKAPDLWLDPDQALMTCSSR